MLLVWWYTLYNMIIVIVGLGNPGNQYENSRHNVGREVAKKFAIKEKFTDFDYKKKANALVSVGVLQNTSVKIVLPETMMNCSGKSVMQFVRSKNSARKLIVLRDDLDLPIGTTKMSFGHGSGGHKGVESVMSALKTKDFIQIKIGISSTTSKGKLRKPIGDEKVISHVLGRFSPKEKKCLIRAYKRTQEALELFVHNEVEKAMQVVNSK